MGIGELIKEKRIKYREEKYKQVMDEYDNSTMCLQEACIKCNITRDKFNYISKLLNKNHQFTYKKQGGFTDISLLDNTGTHVRNQLNNNQFKSQEILQTEFTDTENKQKKKDIKPIITKKSEFTEVILIKNTDSDISRKSMNYDIDKKQKNARQTGGNLSEYLNKSIATLENRNK